MNAGAPTRTEKLDAHPSPRWTLADAEQAIITPFEHHAAQHPERLAVCSRGTRLTYGELNARSNRLAHALIARGVRGDRVALALGHDAAMIAGLLATWKAGMVAVPLEISHPPERLATILADAGCTTILSEAAHRDIADELGRRGALVLPIDTVADGQPSSSNPRLAVAPSNLACLVYTSGSTGKPKGVMQTHRQAMRNVVGYSNVIGIVPDDRLVLLASCAAAQGLATVTCALTNGASLFPFNVREAGVVELAHFIRQQAITLYISAATVFRHLVLSLGENEVLDSVRMVRLGSEPIHGSDVAAFRRHFRPDSVMLTAFSCTETANITLHHVDPARDADLDSVPVGWPVDGMDVLLLDEAGNDVGIGREGEIVVRSRYLSPGYWRDEHRTAAAFVAAADGSDLRCYHTGDLGRRRADGCLIHAGRQDFRVKVRGFGIELEEIETVLRQHPHVQAAVASVRQDKLGDHYLVAHFVPRSGVPPILEDLQQHVLTRLAAHSLPAEYFVVDNLPFTPNGKVDRRAVGTLDGKLLRQSSAFVPPGTAREWALVRAWEDVLSYRPIGVEDNFFAIGGNSLLAGRVIARVAAGLKIELSWRAFLETPTIKELSGVIDDLALDAADDEPASGLPPTGLAGHKHTESTSGDAVSMNVMAPSFRSAKVDGVFRLWQLDEIDCSLATVIERQVARAPDRLAVKGRSVSLTYRQLDESANRLAHALIARGTRGDRVALLLDHDTPMIVGLLATWKAAMVAVPLDVTHPGQRDAEIIAHADCRVVLTNNDHVTRGALLVTPARILLNLDVIDRTLPQTNPGVSVSGSDLAFIIFTSGSTGVPKGVMQQHRNSLRGILAYTNAARITPDDRVAVIASCTVGHGMQTMGFGLSNGATILPFNVREEGVERLAAFLRQERVTIFFAAATVFRHLVRALCMNDVLPSLRLVLLGSEPVNAKDVAAFRRHFPESCEFFNAYGTTETANITLHRVDPKSDLSDISVPVGLPVAGMQVSLIDDEGRAVGIGEKGEIIVCSRYLSPGYWGNEKQTAAVFRDASTDDGSRIYHTGDIGRRQADGTLVHVGRKDFQVEVRGFRVELEEVEAAVRAHPTVEGAAVSVRPDPVGDNQLIVHLVPAPDGSFMLEELQRHLRERLAPHLVPAVFIQVPALPSTRNGKIDRRALTTLEGTLIKGASASIPPRDVLEKNLVAIWEKVLPFRPIGAKEDFFEIGGNSLLAALVTTRVAAAFDIELPLRAFLESPTIAGLARLVHRQHLAKISGSAPDIARVPRGGPIAASFAQQRLWLLDQLEPGSNAYNLPRAIRLKGRLELAALERALGEIVRRHETLRTTFATVNDQPVQVIAEPGGFALTVADCAAATDDPGTGERRMREQLETEAMRPFDLARGPLFRATLFRLSGVEHVLLLNLHHIISDLWSNAILTRELSEFYTTFSQGQPSTLPELEVQYADFAVWQRNRLQGTLLKRQRDYWSARLAGLPALDLPTDRPRPREPATAGALEPVEIPSELTGALAKLARDNRCTLYMTLLAVFQALLHRYTGQEDFAVGGVIAGRNHVAVETLIGFFINTLVHRADVSGNPTFLKLLGRVRDSALGAFEHQELPFERLVEELNPPRDPNRTPFFQVTFLLQNTPRTKLAMPGLTVTNLDTGRGAAKFDLTFSLHEKDGRLRGGVDFNPALFDRATVQRLIGHFGTLCASVVADPSRPVATLEMLSASERQTLLTTWNRTPADQPLDGTLVALVEEQVRRTPHAIALVAGSTRWSFSGLDRQANQLAYLLRDKGVKPDTLVGVFLERGAPLVVTLLGILKAGGAYVPLDPAHPPARLRLIIEDAGLAFFVTQSALCEKLGPPLGATICLDRDAAAIAAQRDTVPEPGASPTNLAYAIYTSGSTGRPKGVAVEHRNVVALMQWARSTFTSDELAGVLAGTSVCFDISVFELFAPLSCGGTIHLAANVLELASLPSAHEVTLINTVPSAIAELLNAHALPRSVCVVNLAGEALPTSTVDRLYALPHVRKVHDLYGPTETTVYSTFALRRAGAPATIGRPLAHEQVYLLDRHQQPVPIGVAGEAYIGGAGVARGYLGSDQLTAERFLPDPFAQRPGARFFRTGDVARYRADGSIEFLGRLDHQVKIRGYRIEPGEIEAVLTAHPDIERSVVVAPETPTGDRRLIAYVVARQAHFCSESELRDFLRARLPEYMVPATFVLLPRLPLTPNGKVDRKSLPEPDTRQPEPVRPYVAPRTRSEESLAAIWREVLGRERIGADDDFFEIGGHSLLAMKVVAQVRRTFGCDLPLRALFDHPTLAGLAKGIDEFPAQRLPHPTVDRVSEVDLEEGVI